MSTPTMRRRLPLFILLATLSLGFWSLTSSANDRAEPADKDEALEHAMEELKDLFRDLNKTLRADGQEQQAADITAEMLKHILTAKDQAHVVHIIEDASPAEQPKLIAEYRIQMNDVIINLAQAENALLLGNKKQAAQFLSEVKQTQRASHKKFKD
ncbi:hypothetical protein KS4_09320 [Poriferisphaera corsica]|uniref:Soluble cytochrome b562 n=1 Tax=Poriferisphaera corsica TaxID=2528020 RepID=A0A517YRQ4_9BACT|nr:hypothetical protein [Poriferisphaera corsica]QDU32893.1 hypothetical protein KS4_09320 [Poriferisphaera corsica]